MNENAAWESATWEGARRAQLRRALTRSVRERLEVLEALTETSDLLIDAPVSNRRGDHPARKSGADKERGGQ